MSKLREHGILLPLLKVLKQYLILTINLNLLFHVDCLAICPFPPRVTHLILLSFLMHIMGKLNKNLFYSFRMLRHLNK